MSQWWLGDTSSWLYRVAAREMRGLTGFDQVALFRFTAQGTAEVLAASTANSAPASTPAPAPIRYARNQPRLIADIDAPTVPIIGTPPLDLSLSALAAASPSEIASLRTFGASAAFLVPIMRRDQTRGLLACHHPAPQRPSFATRAACALFGEFLSFLLEQAEHDHPAPHPSPPQKKFRTR